MSAASREPGWYPDQTDPEFNRYWNGRAWTARRQLVKAPPPQRVQKHTWSARRRPVEGSTPRRRLPIWMWIVGGLMVARSIAGVVAALDDTGAGSSTAGTSTLPTVSTTAPTH